MLPDGEHFKVREERILKGIRDEPVSGRAVASEDPRLGYGKEGSLAFIFLVSLAISCPLEAHPLIHVRVLLHGVADDARY